MTAVLTGVEAELVQVFDSAAAVPVALVVSAAVGAAHGLAPGHGKTIAAGYLVSGRASHRQAAALAVIVAAMHTASVLALGLLWWVTVGVAPLRLDAVTRWVQLAISLIVIALGVLIVRRRWGERGAGHHHHEHSADAAPWSWSGLTAAATTGGLLPSPSAFVVLISGLVTGRVGLALAMVAMFGLGLAATVLLAGSLTVAGRAWLARSSGGSRRRLAELAPLLGAMAVLAGGCLLFGLALADLAALV